MKMIYASLFGLAMGIGTYAAYQATATEPIATVEFDQTFCRAKLSNWLMRYEDLIKPEPDRYRSYRDYMQECVR